MEPDISDLADRGLRPAEIRRELIQRYGEPEVPHLRTLQRMVRELQADKNTAAPWSLRTSTVEQARIALTAIRERGPFVNAWLGRISREQGQPALLLTQREVQWLRRVQEAVPGIPFPVLSFFMQRYLLREKRDESTADIDVALAYAPSEPESPEAFLLRVAEHAKIHCWVWPEETFWVTSYGSVLPDAAAIVHVVLTALRGGAGKVSWVPHREPEHDMDQVIGRGVREFAQLQLEMSQTLPLEEPDRTWAALDRYVAIIAERLGQSGSQEVDR